MPSVLQIHGRAPLGTHVGTGSGGGAPVLSRHLGCHCCVQHQQPQTAANSVHHAHPHLDSTPSKCAGGYCDGIPGVAGGATEPAQAPCGPFPEVMVKTTFDLLTSFDKDARRRLAMSSSLRRHLSRLSSELTIVVFYFRVVLQVTASWFVHPAMHAWPRTDSC